MKVYCQSKLKVAVLPFILLMSFSTVFGQDHLAKDAVIAVEIRDNLTSIDKNLKSDQDPSHIREINFFQDYTMYCIPIYRSMVNARIEDGVVVRDDKPFKEWVEYQYYVFKNDLSKGIRYDSMNVISGKHFDVDSFLKKSAVNILIDTTDYAFAKSITLTNGGLEKKYMLKHRAELPDSIYCYYKSSSNYPNFTISKPLDTVDNMKLSKIVLIFDKLSKRLKKEGKILGFPRELYYELVPVSLKNREDIQSLYVRFKRDIGEK